MRTDDILITSGGDNMENALSQVDKVAEYKELSSQSASVLRLLAEEMMAMMHAITGKVKGRFWMEDDEEGTYALHLAVETLVDFAQREQLLSASSSGKNEAARGFMGKLRAFFETPGSMPRFFSGFTTGAPQMYSDYVWSLEEYRLQLKNSGEDTAEAWDELEKSVVSHLADDVRVGILGRTVEMTIIKKLA